MTTLEKTNMLIDFDWINKVIFSCTNEFHLKCCFEMITKFKIKYGSESRQLEDELTGEIVNKQAMVEVSY